MRYLVRGLALIVAYFAIKSLFPASRPYEMPATSTASSQSPSPQSTQSTSPTSPTYKVFRTPNGNLRRVEPKDFGRAILAGYTLATPDEIAMVKAGRSLPPRPVPRRVPAKKSPVRYVPAAADDGEEDDDGECVDEDGDGYDDVYNDECGPWRAR